MAGLMCPSSGPCALVSLPGAIWTKTCFFQQKKNHSSLHSIPMFRWDLNPLNFAILWKNSGTCAQLLLEQFSDTPFCTLSLFKTQISTLGKSKGEEGGSLGRGKGEGPREKVHMLRICRGVGVFPSRVIQDEYRTWGAQNDRLVFSKKSD